jgi:hypothetical protein
MGGASKWYLVGRFAWFFKAKNIMHAIASMSCTGKAHEKRGLGYQMGATVKGKKQQRGRGLHQPKR